MSNFHGNPRFINLDDIDETMTVTVDEGRPVVIYSTLGRAVHLENVMNIREGGHQVKLSGEDRYTILAKQGKCKVAFSLRYQETGDRKQGTLILDVVPGPAARSSAAPSNEQKAPTTQKPECQPCKARQNEIMQFLKKPAAKVIALALVAAVIVAALVVWVR